TEEWRGLVATGTAAAPEGAIRQLQRDAFGETGTGRLDEALIRRVRDASPLRAHGERRNTREVSLAITGFVELRDRVLYLGVAGDAKIERREHLACGAQSGLVGEAGDAGVVSHDEPPRSIAVGANQLGGAEVCVTNDDGRAAVV